MPEESGELSADQLRAAAAQFDTAMEAGENPEVEIQSEEPEEEVQDESPPEPSAEETGTEPEPEGQDVDEQVSSLTEAETPEEQEQPKSKWAKSEERKNNSWKQINAEKEEIKRQREELLSVANEIKTQKQDIDEGKAYRDEHGFTAADYEKAAEKAELDGDYDEATDAREVAKQVKSEGEKATKEREAKKYWSGVESKRQSLMHEHTELQDSNSELTKTANALFEQYPHLRNSVEGLESTVKIAKLQMTASGADKSKAQVKELTDKLTKLEKKMSVNGGFTSEKLNGEKTFDDLSDREQEEYLRRAAMSLDDAL